MYNIFKINNFNKIFKLLQLYILSGKVQWQFLLKLKNVIIILNMIMSYLMFL